LKTDREGIIHLGRLKNIQYIKATPKDSKIVPSVQKVFVLPK
jgi:hypothetical protein